MMDCTPEQVGISSADVLAFYKKLEARGLSTHSVLMARGDLIFTKCYYAPFNENFLHRMYSVTKSFVSIAIGFCEQDGLLTLDDPLSKYFSEYITQETPKKVASATIRELLRMESGVINDYWFSHVKGDRCATYFEVPCEKYPNTLFDYDTQGSFMLGAIVERVTKRPLLEYLREKVLSDIGFSERAYCLKVPGGHSWGDSALLCTSMDLLLFARWLLNGGKWNEKQYLNEEYVKTAITPAVANNLYGFESPQGYGYGYQIWGAPEGGFFLNGMGCQFAICIPQYDLVCVINSDNQGNPNACFAIFDAFQDFIFDRIQNAPLPENATAYRKLMDFTAKQKLFCLSGKTDSPFAKAIAGKTYTAENNPMGIRWFCLEFHDDHGVFHYENAQGIKALRFGLGHNEFQKFPQTGYSDMIGTVGEPEHMYDCAVSADWVEERTLRVRVQIIDKYFGNLAILFGFRDDAHVTVRMDKVAEDFLKEYSGYMNASSV